MACILCKYCDRFIDLDWDVEHEEECGFELGILDEDGNEIEKDDRAIPSLMPRMDGELLDTFE